VQKHQNFEDGRFVVSRFAAQSPIPLSLNWSTPSPLSDELHQFNIWTRRMNVEKRSEAEWHQWEEAGNALYAKVESLPTTPQNAKVKAHAIWSIIGGDLEDVNDGKSLTDRLVRQMVVALLEDK
jgi:hypothetical protein